MTDPRETAGAAAPFRTEMQQPEPWQRLIKVEVARAHFDREYARVLQAARRRAERPGFRRGHVPLGVIEKEMKAQLRAQAVEEIIPQAYRAAIEEHGFFPVDEPRVANLSLEEGQPLNFEISVEVRPEVTVTGYDGLPLTRRAPNVADEAVTAVVDRLREGRAVSERVDREAKTGDELLLDIVPLDDAGQPQTERRVSEYTFTLGEKGNIAAFDEALAGGREGETRDISVSYPADHFNEGLRGRTINYRAELREVRQRLMPEADDAFAASVKPGETLLGLRGAIRADLLKQEEEAVRRELEEQIVDRLLERNDIPVPPSLVTQYLEAGLRDLHARNAKRGHSDSAEEDARYRELTRPLAERVIRSIFVLEAVRRQEKLETSERDVDARIDEIASEYGFDPERYRTYAAEGPERERIARALEERRSFDFLLSRAAITDAPAAADEG